MTELRPLAPGRLLVGGCPEGFDARYLAEAVARAGGPVVHVARDDARLAAMRASLRFFAPELPVLRFPAWDCLPYDRISPNAEIAAARMATLAALAARLRPAGGGADHRQRRDPAGAGARGAGGARASPPRSAGGSTSAALRGYLARMGFQQAPTVTEPGEFAIRGGLIDLYPPGARGPVRLDLFGDVLESARRFDPETQRTSETREAGRAGAGLRGDPRRRGDPALPHPLPGDVRRRRAATTRSTRRSAPGASSRATSTGCRSSTSGWRRCSTTCPGAPVLLDDQTARGAGGALGGARRAVRRAGRGARARSRSSARSTSRCRRASSTSTTPPGRRRSAGRPLHQLARCRSRSGPA